MTLNEEKAVWIPKLRLQHTKPTWRSGRREGVRYVSQLTACLAVDPDAEDELEQPHRPENLSLNGVPHDLNRRAPRWERQILPKVSSIHDPEKKIKDIYKRFLEV